MIEPESAPNDKGMTRAELELARAHNEVRMAIKEIADCHISIAMHLQEMALERLMSLETGTLTPVELLSYLVTAMEIERISRYAQTELELDSQERDSLLQLAEAIVRVHGQHID